MLSRTNRFHGRNSLNWAYRNAKTVRDQRMTLKYALNPKRQTFRAAVVVSRKVSKSAVVRNRIRRRIYSILESSAKDMGDSYDLIFNVYNTEVANMPHEELMALIRHLLEQAQIK